MKLGDAVKKVTDTLGIEQCDACKERQRKLNEWSDSLFKLIGGQRDPQRLQADEPTGSRAGDRSSGAGGQGEL